MVKPIHIAILLGVVIVCWLFMRGRDTRTERFLGASPVQKIFVSVASYRDADCSDTIRDIFAKALKPERVVIGICEQNSDDSSEDCLPPELSKYKRNVRRLTIPNTEAKGPTYGRALVANVLYGGEDYFLQIDSHTKFVPQWDRLAIEELNKCPEPSKTILSHYPRSWDEYAEAIKPDSGVPVLCKSKIDPGSGIPNLEAVIIKPSVKPRRVPFVSGGFVFGPGRMVKDVPYDPTLDFVFVGEELMHAARLFTYGYDIYTPTRNICTHYYGRSDRPKFWNDLASMKTRQEDSNRKIRRLLGFENPPINDYQYGFGKVRSLSEFFKFAKINPATRMVDSASEFCNWNA